jgi:hypothetical protein
MLRATKKSIDPPTEWTTTLTKFLASLIKEDSHPSSAALRGGASGNANSSASGVTQKYTKLAYVIKLIRWNYSEGLLDRGIHPFIFMHLTDIILTRKEMFLFQMIEQLLDSTRAEDGHILAHLLYPYLPDVAASLSLSRKLYSTCSAKRAKLCIHHSCIYFSQTLTIPISISFQLYHLAHARWRTC